MSKRKITEYFMSLAKRQQTEEAAAPSENPEAGQLIQQTDANQTGEIPDTVSETAPSLPLAMDHARPTLQKPIEETSEPADVSPYDVGNVINKELSNSEKVEMIEKCWKPSFLRALDSRKFGHNKNVSFQYRWLEQRHWLAYSNHPDFRGGWCLPCVLFISGNESEKLGAFVNTPYRNYNKSKELLDGHEKTEYHKLCIERASAVRIQQTHIESRVDVQLNQAASKNIEKNRQILPVIVDAVLLCAKQQFSLRGHRDDNIDFSEPATQNEGNFVAIMRLLAESNPVLKEYLMTGPKNARYTSKSIQNEILHVAADVIRDYFRECLKECPHFALIGDETTSNGRELLSVCISLLDFIADPQCPVKRQVLIDMCDLERTAGLAIATALKKSLESNKIDIRNCRGQAYDTTSSMSSDTVGVHAIIAQSAPDAAYQGCVLHSLNLVICHACKLPTVENMMDACRELYSFFDNSPKRQGFFEIIIDTLGDGDNKKYRLKNLCKTRWIERHTTFETIYELYEFIITTLNEICEPSGDEQIYTEGRDSESWNWDSPTKVKANGLRHTFMSFSHIISFVCSKELLEPMRPIVSALQGQHVDIYRGFQKIDQILNSYSDIRQEMDSWFDRTYAKALRLAELVGSTEQRPRVCSRQRHRDNYPSDTTSDYWKRTVAIPFLDVVCNELRSRFSEEKRAHYELCSLVPEVIITKADDDAVVVLANTLYAKWSHLLPLPSAFESELVRWKNQCKRHEQQMKQISVRKLLSYADSNFFPNIRELLKILAIIPVGSTEAERSFSCIRRVHTWLRSTTTTGRLSDLAVIGMHGFSIPISREQICDKFIAMHTRRMQCGSLFMNP